MNERPVSPMSCGIPLGIGKKCSKCKTVKPIKMFWVRASRSMGAIAQCRECTNKDQKKWREKNPEKQRQHSKRRKMDATVRETQRKWVKSNPEKMRAIKKRSDMKSRSTPKGKLSHCLSRAIYKSLKNRSKNKRHWESLVNFSADQIIKHLEKQFTNGMTWQNYGTYWHVDHKIPIAAFNFEGPEDLDFNKCWSLKNLQPLEAQKNCSKNAKIEKSFQPSLGIGI